MSTTYSVGHELAAAGQPFMPPKEARVVWEALANDAHAAVVVLDSEGVIEFANDLAAAWFRFGSAQACVGRRCAEFLPPEIVEDRLGLAGERLAAGQVVSVVGMCAGKLIRSTFRPLPGPSGMRTLIVNRLAGPLDPLNAAPSEPGVVAARVNDEGPLGVLTAREMEILKLIGLGLSSADIAKRLGRSVKTVEWHRVSLGDKLHVTNRVELARIAIAAGLVGVDGQPSRPMESSGAGADVD